MKRSRLYVSGLWIIESNPKHPPDHYFELLPNTFRLIKGCDLVFFCAQDSVKKMAEELAAQFRINIDVRHFDLPDDEGFQLASMMCSQANSFKMAIWANTYAGLRTNEKGFNQMRFSTKTTPENYARVVGNNLNKVSLVQSILGSTKHEEIFWIDASVARMNGRRKNWDFTTVRVLPFKISHYSSPMRIFGMRQPVQGSCLGADRETWEVVAQLYKSIFEQYVKSGCIYPATDEVLFTLCHKMRPELFYCIDSPPRTVLHKVLGRILFKFNLNSFVLKSLGS